MLGSTADSLFWMFRYLERTENIIYLIETGFQLNLMSSENYNEWNSILKTTGTYNFLNNKKYTNIKIVNFMLRDKKNPNNILTLISKVRLNARKSRVSLTRDVWESINSFWLFLNENLNKNILEKELDNLIKKIKRNLALIFGFIHKTMLRNEILNFCFLGTFLERFDNTLRILNAKFFKSSNNFNYNHKSDLQLELILRSISSYRSYMWKNQNIINEKSMSSFLIFDKTMPKSLIYCINNILNNLKLLSGSNSRLIKTTKVIKNKILSIRISNNPNFHNLLNELIDLNIELGIIIEKDFNFH